jgi:AraC-like DNA-binding protein
MNRDRSLQIGFAPAHAAAILRAPNEQESGNSLHLEAPELRLMQTNTIEPWRPAPAAAAPAKSPGWAQAWPVAGVEHGPAPDELQQLRIDITPVEQILRKTRSVALGRYRCPVDHPQFVLGGGPHTCSYIAFHRTSVRMAIADSRPEVATPNHVSFYNVGESYSREAIGNEGDECDWIALSPSVLRDVHTELAELEAANGRMFPRPFAPMKPETFFAQRKLFATAASPSATMNSLQIDEAVAGLVDRIVADALEFWGCSGKSRRRPRPVCQRRRLRIIEDAKALLAREYWTDLSLADLARQLHCSAAHLSRMFHAATGFRLCDYRQELRLRKGLFLLEETGLEIGDIAVQVGFASHSHFTSAFHRRFGVNPSEFLKWKSRKVIRAMAAY